MTTVNKEELSRTAELDSGKEAVLAAYNNMLEAKEHFKLAAQAAGLDLRSEAAEQLLKGRDKAEALGQQASHYINEKPLATLGLAFLAGFLFSQLFTKR